MNSPNGPVNLWNWKCFDLNKVWFSNDELHYLHHSKTQEGWQSLYGYKRHPNKQREKLKQKSYKLEDHLGACSPLFKTVCELNSHLFGCKRDNKIILRDKMISTHSSFSVNSSLQPKRHGIIIVLLQEKVATLTNLQIIRVSQYSKLSVQQDRLMYFDQIQETLNDYSGYYKY